jgi:hypothetical protein
MTGVADPSTVLQRSVDVGPDTDRETSVQHLIRKRAQQLKEDRESLKASLELYIQQLTIQKWTPPAHPSYNLFDARLKSFDTWTLTEGVLSPDSLAEAGFFYQGTCTNTFLQLTAVWPTEFFTYITHTHFVIIGHFHHTACFHCGIELRDWNMRDGPPPVSYDLSREKPTSMKANK